MIFANIFEVVRAVNSKKGWDIVSIGSDYDGIDFAPKGLEDATTYPKITEELKRRGYSDGSIKKILGGNVLRVMKANFK